MAHATGKVTRLRRYWLVGLAVVVLSGFTAIFLNQTAGFGASARTVPTFTAQRGPLTVSVIESGTIKPQDQIILKNELEGQTTLIFLIPEGTRVEQGQLLAELDASKLEDDRVEQQIKVDNAEAAWIEQRENLAVVRNQADSDISKAELTFNFAQEDIDKYAQGEYPQQLREAENKITLAQETLQRAKEKLDWSERLFAEKYISNIELQADRLTQMSAQLDYDLSVAAKDLLENYTHKRQIDQLKSDLDQARMALERTKLKAAADIVQAEAQLKAKEAEFEQQKNKLKKVRDQIARTKITAPREGLVVYATSTRTGGRGGMTQPLEEGQTVRERQELIYLPSTQAMMAELMIHESSLEKVQPGQPVNVSVDALPGRVFTGTVKSIAPLPDAQTMFMNPDRKLYTTRVNLEVSNVELRTGMSCRAEILIQQLEDAVYIPVQAVVKIEGQPTAFILSGEKFQSRPVQIGLDNSSMVHVIAGLDAGDVVSLAPPLDSGNARLPGGGAASAWQGPTTRAAASQPGGGSTSQPVAGGAAAGEVGPARERRRDMSTDERAARRERMQNMTPEERAAEMRKRMESMTPEQREEWQRRMQERQGRGGPEEGAPGDGPPRRRSSEGGPAGEGHRADRGEGPVRDPGGATSGPASERPSSAPAERDGLGGAPRDGGNP
jgi:HlyD family secretion protein